MNTRTNVRAGALSYNHNEALAGLKVRTTLRAGGQDLNHNDVVWGFKVRTSLKAGNTKINHNEALARQPVAAAPVVGLKKRIRTSAEESERLRLFVIRTGLRAGARFRGVRRIVSRAVLLR